MSLPEGEEERGLAAAFPRCGAGEKLGLILPKPPAHGGRLAALQPLLGQGWPRTPPVSREHRALGSEALEIQPLRVPRPGCSQVTDPTPDTRLGTFRSREARGKNPRGIGVGVR